MKHNMESWTMPATAEAIVVGGSAGALEALSTLLADLPDDFTVPIVIVLHLPRHKPSVLPEVVAAKAGRPVREPLDKEPVSGSMIYVAPADYHLLIDREVVFAFSVDEPVNFSLPSIDVLFESAADVFGARLIGVLLSGANADGASGLKAIEDAGGLASSRLRKTPRFRSCRTPPLPCASMPACCRPRAFAHICSGRRGAVKQPSVRRIMTAKPKILLVDDREENLVALAGLLSGHEADLLCARSGEEALDLLLVHEVALALVDVQMPGMDGFELAELMRGTERTREVPIIFVTAGIHDHARVFKGYDSGAVDFLFKPLDPHILSSKVAVFMQLYRQKQELAKRVRELEVALAERQRIENALKAADRRKNEFLAMLGHELRNPLAPIKNAAQIMKKMNVTDPKLQTVQQVIDRQTGHLARLVEDLLDISRIEQGKITIRKEPIELAAVVDQALESTRPLIQSRQHELIVSVPNVPIRLMGDGARLAQLISNLLNNAAKYTPTGGTIWLTVTREREEALIRVKDNGEGMAESLLSHVFDIFTQSERTLDRAQGGLGLGLAIVKNLVELHQGRIEAYSEGPGKGSEFSVWLPVLA
jgi:signal transduction histidine kinase